MTSLNIKLKNGNEAQSSTQLTHGMAQTINWLAAYKNTDRTVVDKIQNKFTSYNENHRRCGIILHHRESWSSNKH